MDYSSYTDYPVDQTVNPMYSAAATGFWLIFSVLTIVALWKVFVKAGKPGWAGIIPIYNTVVLLQIVGYSGWLILLFFSITLQ